MKTEKRMLSSPIFLAASALLAGVLNGFLGTGGGMALLFSLRAAYPHDEKENIAICTACVLVFSILTTILYKIEGHMDGIDITPFLLPALFGGAVGSLLLGRIRPLLLDLVLSLLLIYAGLSLLL